MSQPESYNFEVLHSFLCHMFLKSPLMMVIKAIYSLSNEQIIEQYSSLQIYQVLVSVKINK